MKKTEATMNPSELDPLKEALARAGPVRLTVSAMQPEGPNRDMP